MTPLERTAQGMVLACTDTDRYKSIKSVDGCIERFSVEPMNGDPEQIVHWSQVVRKGQTDPKTKPYAKHEINSAYQAIYDARREKKRSGSRARMTTFDRLNLGDPSFDRLPT